MSTTTTALATIENISAVDFFKPGASKSILDNLKEEARAIASSLDVSKSADREAMRSLAAKLSRYMGKGSRNGNFVHGYYGTPTYRAWGSMIQRCTNPNAKHYQHYGGRGISICPEWLKFENFLKDMGVRPDGLSIERIDNNGNYGPQNCCWADRDQQRKNRRCTVMVTLAGETIPLTEACTKLGLNRHAVYIRISRGWDPEKALTTPFVKGRNQWS